MRLIYLGQYLFIYRWETADDQLGGPFQRHDNIWVCWLTGNGGIFALFDHESLLIAILVHGLPLVCRLNFCFKMYHSIGK